MSSTRSWAAAARAAGTIRQRKPAWTVHHAQNHALLGSPPAPPCWTSHLAFGLIGFAMPVVTLSFYILTVCYTRIYPLKIHVPSMYLYLQYFHIRVRVQFLHKM
jgi:hypothetical protein